MPDADAAREIILRLKGLAVQIAAQLPDDRADALKVLEYAKEIAEWRCAVPDLAETIVRLFG